MKQVDCYFCGAREHTLYAQDNGHDLVKCAACGLLYVNPRPDDSEISLALRTGLHRGEQTLERIGPFLPQKVAGHRRILDQLFARESPPTGRWLDIGCGNGEFLEALASRFPSTLEAVGLEPSEAKARSARMRGLEVLPWPPVIEPRTFAVISALNVYSHLPDPIEALRRWSSWLAPGGRLILQTGDSCHLPYRHHHKPFDLPDHLSFANRKIVRQILQRLGYIVVGCHHFRHGAYPSWQLWRHPYRDMWLMARRRVDAA